jgi:hypothetical protein
MLLILIDLSAFIEEDSPAIKEYSLQINCPKNWIFNIVLMDTAKY